MQVNGHTQWDNRIVCPPDVRAQLVRLVDGIRHVLGSNLTGIYLHGSLAMGCFNPSSSDLDLLVVTPSPLDSKARQRLASLIVETSLRPRPVEISFLCHTDLFPWRYPSPYQLHYGESHRAWFQNLLATGEEGPAPTEGDPDLAAHVNVVRQRGICLYGAPIARALPEVPAADYAASITSDFDWGMEGMAGNPVYFILNACRIYAYLVDGRVLSKLEGGEWALTHLPGEYTDLVSQALAAYRSEVASGPFDQAALERFAIYMRTTIEELRSRPASSEKSIGHQPPAPSP